MGLGLGQPLQKKGVSLCGWEKARAIFEHGRGTDHPTRDLLS